MSASAAFMAERKWSVTWSECLRGPWSWEPGRLPFECITPVDDIAAVRTEGSDIATRRLTSHVAGRSVVSKACAN